MLPTAAYLTVELFASQTNTRGVGRASELQAADQAAAAAFRVIPTLIAPLRRISKTAWKLAAGICSHSDTKAFVWSNTDAG